MTIDFGPAKDAVNRDKHGLSLARAVDFGAAFRVSDTRRDYGEPRVQLMVC